MDSAYDIAIIFHSLYQNEFKRASRKWYQFKNHRWREIQSIRKHILTKLKHLHIRREKLVSDIIEELEVLLYSKNFVEKLDSNKNLIGFENGVYDLKKLEFRDGQPEDNISFSTGYDYVPINDSTPYYERPLEPILGQFNVKELSSYIFKKTEKVLTSDNIYKLLSQGPALLTSAFGDYATVLDNYIPHLAGKRVVILNNPEKINIKYLESSKVKVCRPLFQDSLIFEPQYTIIIVKNESNDNNIIQEYNGNDTMQLLLEYYKI